MVMVVVVIVAMMTRTEGNEGDCIVMVVSEGGEVREDDNGDAGSSSGVHIGGDGDDAKIVYTVSNCGGKY